MLYENVVLRLLSESKKDSFAGSLTRTVIDAITNNIDQINDLEYLDSKGYQKFSDEINFGEKRVKLTLSIKLDVSDQEKVDVLGAYYDDIDEIKVTVRVKSPDGKIKPQDIRSIQIECYNVIRHEIEHLHWEGPSTAHDVYKEWERDRQNISKLADYYTNEEEAQAHVTGLYNKAKKLRQPFFKVVDEQLKKIEDKVMTNVINKKPPDQRVTAIEELKTNLERIRNSWIEYAKTRLPKAILQ